MPISRVIRTNLYPRPRLINTVASTPTFATSQPDETTGGPFGTGWKRLSLSATATGDANWGSQAAAVFASVVGGQTYTASVYALSSNVTGGGFRVYVRWFDASGTAISTPSGPVDPTVTGDWQRVSATLIAPANAAFATITAGFVHSAASPIQPTDTLGLFAFMLESGDKVRDYFDGDTPDTATIAYDWEGDPNASPSTATETLPAIVEARLLTGPEPQSVQVTIAGLIPGAPYHVWGTTASGGRWEVPGGQGIADDTQVVLIDTLAPLNTTITYVLDLGGGVTVGSNEVTVPWSGKALDGCAVFASLNGTRAVPVMWVDNRLPEALEVYSVSYPVPGRARRPGRYTPTGDGSGQLEVIIASEHRQAWRELLRPGEVIVTRTDGKIADWPPVEIIACTALSSQLRPLARDKTARLWSIDYELVDLPDPTLVIVVFTWDNFDTVYAGQTWDDFDAEWQATTWDDFDRYDWGQRL